MLEFGFSCFISQNENLEFFKLKYMTLRFAQNIQVITSEQRIQCFLYQMQNVQTGFIKF